MDMIIAIIVLAAAATVSFMSFITLSKQINTAREENRAHWKSVEDSIDYQRNRLLKEIQEGHNVLIQDVGLLACQLNNAKENINKTTKEQVSRIVYTVPMIDLSAYTKVTGRRHGK